MLIVLSPAKTLDYDSPVPTDEYSVPDFVERAAELVAILKAMPHSQLASLMRISDPLAALNVARYASWSSVFSPANARQAIFAFNGDVYEGLDASTLTQRQLGYAQAHVRMLSGLYGVLRPLDLMQPYRLEMGTRLTNRRGKDLYTFWGNVITEALNQVLASQKEPVLINLASEEYFKAVKPDLLNAQVITPIFEEQKAGQYKVISFHAKRARGLMTRYAILNGITRPERLKSFDLAGYAFNEAASTPTEWVFRRSAAQ